MQVKPYPKPTQVNESSRLRRETTTLKELGKLFPYLRNKGNRFGDTKMGVTTFY